MANVIGYPQQPELPELDFDDRKMHIFCSVLALAGSALAGTEQEGDLAFFFCSRDLKVLGRGMAGFDMGELPWGDDLEKDRRFLQYTCTAAHKGLGWERLGYHPDKTWLLPAVDFLERLIGLFEAAHIDEPDPTIQGMRPATLDRCPKHGVFMHSEGCLICVDW